MVVERTATIYDVAVGDVAVYYGYCEVLVYQTAWVAFQYHIRYDDSLAVCIQRYVDAGIARKVRLWTWRLRYNDPEIFRTDVARKVSCGQQNIVRTRSSGYLNAATAAARKDYCTCYTYWKRYCERSNTAVVRSRSFKHNQCRAWSAWIQRYNDVLSRINDDRSPNIRLCIHRDQCIYRANSTLCVCVRSY